MAGLSHHEIVELFSRAVPHDVDALKQYFHEDFVQEFPQSRERFEGFEAFAQANRGLSTGKAEDREVQHIRGSEDKYVVTPSFTTLRITGTGDQYTIENRSRYPDGSIWYVVTVLEFRGDKISKATNYFAAPFDAPESRAEWAKRMAD
jgi:ketosteroid isomerase-like protein